MRRFSTDTITSLRGVRHEPSISFNTINKRVCQTVDDHLLLVLLNLLLQTTEFLTINHRATGVCVCVCAHLSLNSFADLTVYSCLVNWSRNLLLN